MPEKPPLGAPDTPLRPPKGSDGSDSAAGEGGRAGRAGSRGPGRGVREGRWWGRGVIMRLRLPGPFTPIMRLAPPRLN